MPRCGHFFSGQIVNKFSNEDMHRPSCMVFRILNKNLKRENIMGIALSGLLFEWDIPGLFGFGFGLMLKVLL